MSVLDIPVATITGEDTTLGDHAGKVLLVVNVASKCGLTPQYEALEALYEQKRSDGFEVLGFPANDFGGQEPGTDAEIAEFCATTYAVQFPLYSKIVVTGDDKHPLYEALVAAIPEPEGGDPEDFRTNLRGHGITPSEAPDVVWNFEKFLVAKDGTVARRFVPGVVPDDPELVAAIEAELAR
ncbi:MAG TPA: glutathione peroxidase [Acidimicrobiales bacterium]